MQRAAAREPARLWRALQAGLRGFSAESSSAARPDVAIAGGSAPLEANRRVLIYSPARTAYQSGLANTIDGANGKWSVQFDTKTKWANPLIGWTSTADASENVYRQLYFDTADAAVAFAKKNGWSYEVVPPQARSKARPKRFQGYGDKFSVKRNGIPTGGLRSEAKKA